MSVRSARDPEGGRIYYEVDDGKPVDPMVQDLLRPRDSRDDDADPESVRGKVLAFYDALDASKSVLRDALETEWYNGNLTGSAHDRLLEKLDSDRLGH